MAMIRLMCLLTLVLGSRAAFPAGCSLNKGIYECDVGWISRSLDATEFSNPPAQRIRIYNITDYSISWALLGASFASIDTTSFDINWAPTLELKCDGETSITLSTVAFDNANYIKDFKIINCMNLTAGISAFDNLGSLDRFVIENGTITSFDNAALTGVDISKETTSSPEFPVKTGELILMNSRVVGSLGDRFLVDQTNLVSVTLEGLGLTTLNSAMFSTNTKLRFISLGYNSFTELPSGLFDGLNSLAELHLYDTQLDCSCSKLWFYGHAETTGMKIRGDITCLTPSNWENYRAASYYNSECVEEEVACKGLTLMGACITYFELGMYIMCIIAFILAGVVLGLVIHTKRQMGGAAGGKGKRKPGAKGGRKPGAGGRKPPPKGAKNGWA